jgi:ABC-type lipoprotein release transport system permease subunit
VALGLIVGVIGGVVIASSAGARRTATAYPRFVAAENGLNVVADASARDPATGRRLLHEMLSLPQVESSSRVFLVPAGLQIEGRHKIANVFPIVSPDGRFGTTINGIKILDGRMYRRSSTDEVVASSGVAQEQGIRVGDTLRMECCGIFGKPYPKFQPPPTVTLHVVGIGAAPGMFQPLAGGYLPGVFISPGFYRAYPGWINQHDQTAAVVLRHGLADARPFVHEVRALREHLPPHSRIQVPFNQAQQTVGVQQATRAQAISLWVLAALVALAGVAVFAQALARQTFLESIEYPTLRSLGMSPGQLVAVGMTRAAVVGLIGATTAAVVGFLLSPLTPTGLARLAEPNPGLYLDLPVVVAGALGTFLVVALLGAIPAWRASRVAGNALGTADPFRSRRPSAVASLMGRWAFPPSATAGVRMAMEPGRGRTAVPVRTTMFGASLSILALAAALVFAASLDRLVTTPRLAGYSWDVLAFPSGGGNGAAQERKIEPILDRSPKVNGYSIGGFDNITIGPIHLLVLTMDPRKGHVVPSIAAGRLPSAPDEIALGRETLRQAHAGIGDWVTVSHDTHQFRMRVVGQVAVPPIFFSFARPGQGAAMTWEGAHRFHPERPLDVGGLFLKFAPGVNQDAFHTELKRRVGRVFWLPRQESAQVHNLGGIGNVPLVLAGIVALMAAATLAHTLITSIRRRRLDLAILKTLGFVRRQVSATVAWQATTLGAVALLIGLPLGIVSGRWGWNVFADRLGVVPAVAVPLISILLAVPATIVVANLLAVVPGRIASRLRPGPILRSE